MIALNGLIVMDIDVEDGIEEIGRVDHSDLAYQACIAQQRQYQQSYQQSNPGWSAQSFCGNPQNQIWYANMRRSIIIDDGIVSISSAGMKFNRLDDLDETLATIPLPAVW